MRRRLRGRERSKRDVETFVRVKSFYYMASPSNLVLDGREPVHKEQFSRVSLCDMALIHADAHGSRIFSVSLPQSTPSSSNTFFSISPLLPSSYESKYLSRDACKKWNLNHTRVSILQLAPYKRSRLIDPHIPTRRENIQWSRITEHVSTCITVIIPIQSGTKHPFRHLFIVLALTVSTLESGSRDV